MIAASGRLGQFPHVGKDAEHDPDGLRKNIFLVHDVSHF